MASSLSWGCEIGQTSHLLSAGKASPGTQSCSREDKSFEDCKDVSPSLVISKIHCRPSAITIPGGSICSQLPLTFQDMHPWLGILMAGFYLIPACWVMPARFTALWWGRQEASSHENELHAHLTRHDPHLVIEGTSLVAA